MVIKLKYSSLFSVLLFYFLSASQTFAENFIGNCAYKDNVSEPFWVTLRTNQNDDGSLEIGGQEYVQPFDMNMPQVVLQTEDGVFIFKNDISNFTFQEISTDGKTTFGVCNFDKEILNSLVREANSEILEVLSETKAELEKAYELNSEVSRRLSIANVTSAGAISTLEVSLAETVAKLEEAMRTEALLRALSAELSTQYEDLEKKFAAQSKTLEEIKNFPTYNRSQISKKTHIQIKDRIEILLQYITALIDNKNLSYPPELTERNPVFVTNQLAEHRSAIDETALLLAEFEDDKRKILADLEVYRMQGVMAERGLSLIRKEIETVAPLVRSGLAPETRLLALQGEEEEFIGEANNAKASEMKAQALLAALEEAYERSTEKKHRDLKNYQKKVLTWRKRYRDFEAQKISEREIMPISEVVANIEPRIEIIYDNNDEVVLSLQAELSEALDMIAVYEDREKEHHIKLQNLGNRLNAALARAASEERKRRQLEVAERDRLIAEAVKLQKERNQLADQAQNLANYKSEFFGRLREILAGQEGVKIVGDRFVFSSEVLFEPGAASLSEAGQLEIDKVANILLGVKDSIPDTIEWVIRVDGHTDDTELSGNGRYRDNWELSQARALSVVRYMANNLKFPEDRLAANGFGEFQPINRANTNLARSQNRRIEIKLTER